MNLENILNRTVIANRLDSITQEMGLVLENSAHSPIFAEACDFACCICDHQGNLVSQLSGIPILATAGSFSVKAMLRRYGENIKEGEAFIINDPYEGGNHLPDIGIITPIFSEGDLLFFGVSRAHHGDIGGSTAGSYNPKATEIFQEGLRIPPTKIMVNNQLSAEVLELIIRNTRNPLTLKSDLLAQIGANRLAAKRIGEMVVTYSAAVVKKAVADILAQAELLTRKRIGEVPDGVYRATEYLDDDGFQSDPVKLEITIKVQEEQMLIDFSGTDSQVKGFINTSVVTATTAARIAALWFLGADIPRNDGAFRCIKVNLPPGSLVNPQEPAPVTLCTLTPASEIIGCIFQALNQAIPGRVSAGYGRYAGPSFYGTDPRSQRYYVGFSFCSLGGGGAGAGQDGQAYMAPFSNFGGIKTPNIESNEVQYPQLTLWHELAEDTAGAGEYRGGAGIKYAFQINDGSGAIVMFGDGMKYAPYGLEQGQNGSLNKARFVHEGQVNILASKEAPRSFSPGDLVYLESSGGGGWGNPWKRPWEKVYADFLDEIISLKTAREVYGVIIEEKRVNFAQTDKMRTFLAGHSEK